MRTVTVQQVRQFHAAILRSGDLAGVATDRPLEAVLARVQHRLVYGLINDPIELAACYARVITIGHPFDDGNKRAAFATFEVILRINEIRLIYDSQQMIKWILDLTTGGDEVVDAFIDYLRHLPRRDS